MRSGAEGLRTVPEPERERRSRLSLISRLFTIRKVVEKWTSRYSTLRTEIIPYVALPVEGIRGERFATHNGVLYASMDYLIFIVVSVLP